MKHIQIAVTDQFGVLGYLKVHSRNCGGGAVNLTLHGGVHFVNHALDRGVRFAMEIFGDTGTHCFVYPLTITKQN